MSVEKKRTKEKRLLAQMIKIYCKGKHGSKLLCEDCAKLLAYSENKTDKCPRMAHKKFCSGCPHPCYAPEQREAIKAVMKYSGPRLIFYAPKSVIKHGLETLRRR